MPDSLSATIPQLVDRARALVVPGRRRLLGLTGPPGAGKSTVARRLVAELPSACVLVPMDGFHLANVTLLAWGRRDRKGAIDTFDAGGYVHLLRRLRAADEEVVHAPDFDRNLEESIGSAIPVPRDVPLVITEGNYLLSRQSPWAEVAELLTETWYVDVDDATRLSRLTARHVAHGKDPDAAQAWASGSDQANAELIAQDRDRADLIVTVVD